MDNKETTILLTYIQYWGPAFIGIIGSFLVAWITSSQTTKRELAKLNILKDERKENKDDELYVKAISPIKRHVDEALSNSRAALELLEECISGEIGSENQGILLSFLKRFNTSTGEIIRLLDNYLKHFDVSITKNLIDSINNISAQLKSLPSFEWTASSHQVKATSRLQINKEQSEILIPKLEDCRDLLSKFSNSIEKQYFK